MDDGLGGRGAAIGVSALWEIHFLNGAKVGPLVVVRDLVLVWCEAVNMAPQPLSQTLPFGVDEQVICLQANVYVINPLIVGKCLDMTLDMSTKSKSQIQANV